MASSETSPIVDKLYAASSMPDRDWWQALWPDPLRVLRAIGTEEGMIVLDLCCGDGYFTAPLSKLVRGRVYGVDLDPAMLEQTRREIKHTNAPMCQLIEGDAADLPQLLPEKVDYALLANTFHGVPDKTGLSEAVHAVLKPRGLFTIINWYPKPREQTPVLDKPRGPRDELRMSPEDVRKVIEPAGYSPEAIVELPPYHYGIVFCRD